jgi:acyl dehydratase
MSHTSPVRTIRSTDELKALVGHELGVGPWVELTQARVDAYAEETGDRQAIYVEPGSVAAESRFGGRIAQPFLLLGMINLMQRNRDGIRVEIPARSNVNYGLNDVRFISPVRVGTRLRARTTLLSVESVRDDVVGVTYRITVEVDGAPAPVLVADMLTRLYR